MSAETAGHRFLGDDLKKSAIITFCFYIIAFVLFSALVFGTTLRLKLKYIQCESLAACCALFFVSVFVLLRTSDVFRNRRAVWLALVPSVFFCGAYTVLCFFSLKSTFVLYYYTGTLIFPFLLLISHLLMRGLQPLSSVYCLRLYTAFILARTAVNSTMFLSSLSSQRPGPRLRSICARRLPSRSWRSWDCLCSSLSALPLP